MWSSSVWGLLSLAVSCALTMISVSPESEWQKPLQHGTEFFCCHAHCFLLASPHQNNPRRRST